MAANPARRARLADAGLEVLSRDGARGLTHRAVDAEADEPTGTTSNYFRSRDALLAALADRIFERLQPPEEVVDALGTLPRTVETYARYMADIVDRGRAQPGLWIALLELRLEATRRPGLADRLGETLNRSYRVDVEHHRRSGLPGGDLSVLLLHHAMTGVMLDVLTPSVDPSADPDATVRALVDRLVR